MLFSRSGPKQPLPTTMGFDTEGTDRGTETEGQYHPNRPSLEDTGMVSDPTNPPSGTPNHPPSNGGHDITGEPTTSPNPGSRGGIGGMAYIRRSCEAGSLSREATKLLMSSWCKKSQSSYNSLFHKWECWCAKRDRNPI